MRIKNWIGDMLGYARCPVTDRTYWREKVFTVVYKKTKSSTSGIIVSRKALDIYDEKAINKIIQLFLKVEHNKDIPLKQIHILRCDCGCGLAVEYI